MYIIEATGFTHLTHILSRAKVLGVAIVSYLSAWLFNKVSLSGNAACTLMRFCLAYTGEINTEC